MIVDLRINNYSIFPYEVNFSMEANMKIKLFPTNIYKEKNANLLKVGGIFGPNNAGKSCLVSSLESIKKILLNQKVSLVKNFFSNKNIIEMGITFLHSGKQFDFNFKFDDLKKEYIYEYFCERIGKNEKKELIIRDVYKNNYFISDDSELSPLLSKASKSNLLIHLIDEESSKTIKKVKNIVTNFANRMEIIDMNKIRLDKTIYFLKNNKMKDKIVHFIKNADIYLDDFSYMEDRKIEIEQKGKKYINKEIEKIIPQEALDELKLMSVYKGKKVPSILFDSIGTKKIESIAAYIIEALEEGKILIIDELDSSLYFSLTRSIISLFNNELNNKAQLLFTAHDITLLDCKKLFRKDQIWFIHKEENDVYLYSLDDFTSRDGVRETSDIIEKYKRGVFGAVPNPDIIQTLYEVIENEK